MSILKDKSFIGFVIKFLLLFVIFYYGTLAVIGLSAPGGYYSPFVAKYLDYISLLRISLMGGTKILLSLFGIDTYYASEYVLRKINGTGFQMVYQCLGYGVMSFWVAFVAATAVPLLKKTSWVILGLIMLYLINITRLSLVLVAGNNKWKFPFGWDHHTWFNIFAYISIFTMMYFFDRSTKAKTKTNKEKTS